MSLLNKLQKLNFSKNQAQVYLALMEIGEGTALNISKNTNIPKSTVFEILKQLNKDKYVSINRRGSKNIFSVTNPAIIAENLSEQSKIAEEILPELKGFYKALNKDSKMKFFEGPKAIEMVIKEALSEARELKVIGSIADAVDFYPDYFPSFSRQRIKHKISLKIISNDTEISQENILLDKKHLRQTKIIKNKKFSSMIWLWSGKVGFIATKGKQFAMIMDDVGVSEVQNVMFDAVWEAINL